MPARGSVPPAAPGYGSVHLDALVELTARRLSLAVDVAAAKFASGQPVDDPVREREILRLTAGSPGGARPGHAAGAAFLRDQIAASKIVQRGLLACWHGRPADVPGHSPGLSEDVRPALDEINRQLLPLLSLLDGTTPEQRALAEAALVRNLAATRALRDLGAIRRDAARTALRSLPSAVPPGNPRKIPGR